MFFDKLNVLLDLSKKSRFALPVDIINIKQPDNKHCKLMCYVFDEEVGQTKEMLLIYLSAIIASKINILYHMSESNKN